MSNHLNVLPQASAKASPAVGDSSLRKVSPNGDKNAVANAEAFQASLNDAVHGNVDSKTLGKDGDAVQSFTSDQQKKAAEKAAEQEQIQKALALGAQTLPNQLQNQTVVKAEGGDASALGRNAEQGKVDLLKGGKNSKSELGLLLANVNAAQMQQKQNAIEGKDSLDQSSLKQNGAKAQLNPATAPALAGVSLQANPQMLEQLAQQMQAQQGLAQEAQNDLSGADFATGAGVMAGVDLGALAQEHQFKIEGMETQAPKLPSSKFSTNDYLNLREISQNGLKNSNEGVAQNLGTKGLSSSRMTTAAMSPAMLSLSTQAGSSVESVKGASGKGEPRKGKAGAIGAEAGAAGLLGQAQSKHASHTVEAQVAQGPSSKMVLTKEAVQNIGHQVNLMSQAKQDGEIKIRLRPDHLGELQMSVKTEGQMVSIQIRAQDGEAKKIIEESLGSLRDHLSAKDLTLSSISVVTPGSNSADGNFQADNSAQRQNFDQAASQQFADQRSNQQWSQSEQNSGQQRYFEDEAPRSNLVRVRPNVAAKSATGSARLDMIA